MVTSCRSRNDMQWIFFKLTPSIGSAKMKKPIFKALTASLIVCTLSLAGYLVGETVELPPMTTWTVEESNSTRSIPADRAIERQIRALTGRDPMNAASMNFQHEPPWLYGVRTQDGWVVPGVSTDSPMLGMGFPVKIISWTGETANGARHKKLDQVATEYALKYNRQTEIISLTN